MKTKLFNIAHSRAGDKGDTLTLSLIPYNEADYDFLCRAVTPERVKHHLQHIVKGDVLRYEIPGIRALLFVCSHALCGGVTTSLSIDTHGKCMSSALLEMEV